MDNDMIIIFVFPFKIWGL